MSKFPIFIERVLKSEGGFTNRKDDPGNWTGGVVGKGELNGTNFGISAASYPNTYIADLTKEEAIAIYKRDFWDPCHCDMLPDAVAFSALDGAVNSGINQSIRWLQQATCVADDGLWGPITEEALSIADEDDLLLRYNGYRLRFMTRLSTWNKFGSGWASRIAQNLLYGAEDN